MTASSPWTLGMIDTRKSIVLPGTRSLNRPSCGTRFSAMSSSAITLMREMMALWCCFAIGRIAACSTPSMRYFTHDRIVLGLDVDVRRAALDRREDGGVHQPDHRADVARQPLDREVLVAALLVLEQLDLEALGGFLQHALRALALLENRLDRGPRPDQHPQRRRQQHLQLVDHREVARVRHHDDQRPAVAAIRDEAVPQHEVGRDRPEQLVVDAEVIEVGVLEAVPLARGGGLPPARRRRRRGRRRPSRGTARRA